ncbi:hypothetical protein SH661x_004246 [Planctomicrobium sp. SH661]|uniref:hypothetical protein n=1 Tax=Planctomicrobium sp. SH661 TaxID=3448124 RepID=UPI003F5B491D
MNRTISHVPVQETPFQSLVRQLGEQEFRRRLWHFLPGVIALTMAGVPHRETVRLWVMVLVVICGIFLPALAAIRYQRLYCRSECENLGPSIFGYVLPLSVLCLLFRSHIEIPLTVAAIIAFGDGSATLVGLLVRGAKVPWNAAKSWAGLFAFAVCGSLLASTVYWIAARHHADFSHAFLCVAPVVAVCSFLETLPLKLNDNITIGCSSALLLVAMQTWVIGW